MKWFFLLLAVAVATFEASEASATHRHRAPRQQAFFRPRAVVFFQPQAVLVAPPAVTYYDPGIEVRSFGVPATVLYQQYQSSCRREGISAVPFGTFSINSGRFHGSARHFNAAVGFRF
jgi:hypothetical protein